MNKLFKRQILEKIDYFNYIDPDIFYDKSSDDEDDKKKDKEKKYTKNKYFSKKQAKDIRKYMQYSNVKND